MKTVGAAGGIAVNLAPNATATIKRHPYTQVGDYQAVVVASTTTTAPPAPTGWTYSPTLSDATSGCSAFYYHRFYTAGAADFVLRNNTAGTLHYTGLSTSYRGVHTTSPYIAVSATHGAGATITKTGVVNNTLKGSIATIFQAAKAYGPSSVNGVGLRPYNYTLKYKIVADTVANGNDPGITHGEYLPTTTGNIGPFEAGNESYTAPNTKTHISASSDLVALLRPANPLVPINVNPYSGSTVNNDVATLSGTVQASGTKARLEYEFATDAAFTTEVRYVWEPTQSYRDSGSSSVKIPEASQLFQGDWYLRVRAQDQNLQYGPWTATIPFTVSHPPSAINLAPGNGQGVPYDVLGASLSWDFSDTSETDTQTAYQIVVMTTVDDSVVVDTGKITSTDNSALVVIPSGNKGQLLYWKIRLWDSDDVAGPYATPVYFMTDDPPVVTASLDPTELQKPYPTISWSSVISSGRTQAKWQVVLTRVSDNKQIADSGLQAGTDETWTSPVQLHNAVAYTWDVTVTDSGGLTGEDTETDTLAFVQPPAVTTTVDGSSFESDGYVIITWTASVDDNLSGYNVYRREAISYTNLGVPVYGDPVLVGATDTTLFVFRDYFAAASTQYQYGVASVATRYGDPVEGNINWVSSPDTGWVSTNYWLIHPTDRNYDIKLPHVSGNGYSEEHLEEVFEIPGQGRRADTGGSLGRVESLTCKLYDLPGGLTATQQRKRLEQLREERQGYYYRNPFGDFFLALISDISGTRTPGTGVHEYSEVSFDVRELGTTGTYTPPPTSPISG